MQINEITENNDQTSIKIKHIATVKINFPDADFWLIRKGDIKKVGKPSKKFDSEYIGVKIKDTENIDPKYMYYVFEYIHSTGYFEKVATGMLKLQHITTQNVKDIELVGTLNEN